MEIPQADTIGEEYYTKKKRNSHRCTNSKLSLVADQGVLASSKIKNEGNRSQGCSQSKDDPGIITDSRHDKTEDQPNRESDQS